MPNHQDQTQKDSNSNKESKNHSASISAHQGVFMKEKTFAITFGLDEFE
jgi:hypothetical protein